MTPVVFSTRGVSAGESVDAWLSWFDGLYEVSRPSNLPSQFDARSVHWTIGDGLVLANVRAPGMCAVRPLRLIRHNPIDHWVITVGKRASTQMTYRDDRIVIPPRTIFVTSMADRLMSDRPADERVQLYLSRDGYGGLAGVLDPVRGSSIATPRAALLRDFLLVLAEHLPALNSDDLPRLAHAIEAMVQDCLAAPPDESARSTPAMDFVRRERARQVIRRHLRSEKLGPALLCSELGTSRSQLYRLFLNEGGVGMYIRRCRLLAARAALTDPSDTRGISAIAADCGFYDAPTFTRAFRREFGLTPSEVREIRGTPPRPRSEAGRRFQDWLASGQTQSRA